MDAVSKLPVVAKPVPFVAQYKGKDNELNMNGAAIGDYQAEALANAVKVAK
jgi:hypothetical protein